jgi:hypothetical protein
VIRNAFLGLRIQIRLPVDRWRILVGRHDPEGVNCLLERAMLEMIRGMIAG